MVVNRNQLKKAIYVGDTKKDYLAALKNHLPFIWAKYGFGICDNYDNSMNNIQELTNLVTKVFQ